MKLYTHLLPGTGCQNVDSYFRRWSGFLVAQAAAVGNTLHSTDRNVQMLHHDHIPQVASHVPTRQ